MKIAITHPYAWPEVRRGAERIAVETARALAGRGHEVVILTSGRRPGRTTDGGVVTVKVGQRFPDGPRHEAWFGWRIMPLLLRGRYDVVHSLMPQDALAAIRTGRLAHHRVVYEELGLPIVAWWDDKPDRAARRKVLERVDVYGCMSSFALDMLRRDSGRNGALIPGGVRLDEFRPASARAEVPTILFSGTLAEPRKGVHLLLEALPVVANDCPDVQLWLSGPGDASALLAQAPPASRERTTVLPIGEPHDQAERYATAWVTALPSVNESFGMVLVESLASGTPIVVANHSAPPELARPGVGTVCEPDDVGSLAQALVAGLTLAQAPAVAERCRAVAAEFDWDSGLAPMLEEIYLAAEPTTG